MRFEHSMEKDNRPGNPTLLRLAPTTSFVAYTLTARAMQTLCGSNTEDDSLTPVPPNRATRVRQQWIFNVP
ncbi:hypothetical protein LMG28688_02990 [Paraburkholderia caffeinitolerans]|uniref:Uncharacterized protein n=1 Tax=Paraburkholderia caffeinitolerans TaxID=1723730 RepID=A0A6J5G4C9_9BURK|nr:hypothetical protein [Paraburkholderia caffeinitolerans]CAB3789796.1 hypothetical protein LMG28688_02990 [Paraburkholderia caffeinitolerans]